RHELDPADRELGAGRVARARGGAIEVLADARRRQPGVRDEAVVDRMREVHEALAGESRRALRRAGGDRPRVAAPAHARARLLGREPARRRRADEARAEEARVHLEGLAAAVLQELERLAERLDDLDAAGALLAHLAHEGLLPRLAALESASR